MLERVESAAETGNRHLLMTVVGMIVLAAFLAIIAGFGMAMSWLSADAPPLVRQALAYVAYACLGLLVGRSLLGRGGDSDD